MDGLLPRSHGGCTSGTRCPRLRADGCADLPVAQLGVTLVSAVIIPSYFGSPASVAKNVFARARLTDEAAAMVGRQLAMLLSAMTFMRASAQEHVPLIDFQGLVAAYNITDPACVLAFL